MSRLIFSPEANNRPPLRNFCRKKDLTLESGWWQDSLRECPPTASGLRVDIVGSRPAIAGPLGRCRRADKSDRTAWALARSCGADRSTPHLVHSGRSALRGGHALLHRLPQGASMGSQGKYWLLALLRLTLLDQCSSSKENIGQTWNPKALNLNTG